MQIANPIYDSVFKFLMEDTPSAILLLSTIISEEIIELEFLPQENIQQLSERSLTVYRLDFCAKIRTASGDHKQVLIEIQKAKLPSDIMRFRRYLGEQYAKKSNRYPVTEKQGEREITHYKPLPILTLYFLGYALEHLKAPVIKVNRHYYDVVGNRQIHETEAFIESLTHDSYVIQISQLGKSHQSELEQLLAIFEQQRHLETDEHILDIDEQDYPEKYHALIRRLQQAIAEPDIRRNMDAEDEILADLQDMERVIEVQAETLQKNREELQKNQQELQKNQQELQKNQQELQKNQQELQKNRQEMDEKDRLIAELQRRLEND